MKNNGKGFYLYNGIGKKCFAVIEASFPGEGEGGLLLGSLGRGVPPASSNPDPISDQNMSFSTSVFRPGL